MNVSADGNMGVTSGITAISETTQPPDSAFRSGNFISVWRRSAPSEWKIIAHMENGLADSVSVLFPAPPTAHVRTVGGRDYAADLAFARMAADSGAPVAFGAFAAPDATMISGAGDVLVGPSAIRSRMLDRPAARALWSWSPLYAGGSTGGDLGYTVGEATIRASAADDASVVYSKYLTVWRRQPDGTLRFLTDGDNARPVP